MSILVPFHAQRTSSYCPHALIVLTRFPPLHHVRGSEREGRALTSFKILSLQKKFSDVEVKLPTLVVSIKAFIKVDALHSNVV